jgi:polyisoprenoid-binding protein YceI
MQRFDASRATCRVYTFKEGLLSTFAHDLQIRVTRFEIGLDEARRAVEGRFDASSLQVVCAMKDGVESPGALTSDNHREIERNIERDVLEANRYPDIHFVSTSIADVDGGHRVEGTLHLHGVARPISFVARAEGDLRVAEVRLHQPDFGIRPYRAMLGALQVKPEVVVQIAVPAG